MLRPTIYIPSRQLQRLDPRPAAPNQSATQPTQGAPAPEANPAGEPTSSPEPELLEV